MTTKSTIELKYLRQYIVGGKYYFESVLTIQNISLVDLAIGFSTCVESIVLSNNLEDRIVATHNSFGSHHISNVL